MRQQQATYFDMIVAVGFMVLLTNGILFSIHAGSYGLLVIVVPIWGFIAYNIYHSLRQGLRQPTPFERFEQKLLIRTLGIFLLVPPVIVTIDRWLLRGSSAGVHVGWILASGVGWLGLAAWSARQLRGKHETSAGYKRRVGWSNDESAGE